LFKERKLLIDAQREVEDMHKKLHSFEAELSALKEEKETLQLKLKEEKGRINILDQQKKSLQAALDEYKKKEVCSLTHKTCKIWRTIPNVMVEWIVLLLDIQEILEKNLGLKAGCLCEKLCIIVKPKKLLVVTIRTVNKIISMIQFLIASFILFVYEY
jgi:predicted nuclease with TOPRIM domain